jgi:gamma-butyrobetaine dioxygenase
MPQTLEQIERLFYSVGGRAYLGEAVSLANHMLRAGALAEADGAAQNVVAAALLHDVGHLVAPTSTDVDARHEVSGADWLAALGFPESVTEPVRLHVVAKRYLCMAEPEYFNALSAASRRTLVLQGGPMHASSLEAEAFRRSKYAEAAVAVRRWDEAAKDPSPPRPAFSHFRPLLESLVRQPLT